MNYTVIKKAIYEGSSYYIEYGCVDIHGEDLSLSDVKVFIFLMPKFDDDEIVYINNRDGTNNAGLALSGNHVSLLMSPDDNAIVLSNCNYEKHIVMFKIFYNDNADIFYVEFEVLIKNIPIVE